ANGQKAPQSPWAASGVLFTPRSGSQAPLGPNLGVYGAGFGRTRSPQNRHPQKTGTLPQMA
ncbi:MAG: hypothetical protein LBF38_00340, partial [Deltaproteobacteria bacterium]|nr:hypothetical protein [Deltaproteobacteria bacterium]